MDSSTTNLASPTPRKLSTLRVPMLTTQQRQSGGPPARPQIQRTSLSSVENSNAIEAWETLVHESYLSQMADLEQLLHSLQIPLQPISLRACQEEFQRSKGRFSFRDFVSLLERLKTLHGKWMHKLRGKMLDDDLLEAFVAVGGQSDSNGEVDLSKMRAVVGEFQLNVDLDKIIAEMDNDGSANIDFGEFASLIRDSANNPGGATSKHKSPPRRNQPQRGGGGGVFDDEDEDLFNMDSLEDGGTSSPGIGGGGTPAPITLSSMMYVDEDLDQALLFPPLGLTSRKQEAGELSTRKRSEMNLLTHRKKSMMNLHGATSGETTPHGGGPGGAPGATGGASSNTAHGGEGKARIGNKTSSSPSRSTRTRLAQVHVANNAASATTHEKTGGGATAFYKGGGGLRNLTPAPGALASKHNSRSSLGGGDDNGPSRSQSSMSNGNASSTSPLRGTVRASKKHKFAN